MWPVWHCQFKTKLKPSKSLFSNCSLFFCLFCLSLSLLFYLTVCFLFDQLFLFVQELFHQSVIHFIVLSVYLHMLFWLPAFHLCIFLFDCLFIHLFTLSVALFVVLLYCWCLFVVHSICLPFICLFVRSVCSLFLHSVILSVRLIFVCLVCLSVCLLVVCLFDVYSVCLSFVCLFCLSAIQLFCLSVYIYLCPLLVCSVCQNGVSFVHSVCLSIIYHLFSLSLVFVCFVFCRSLYLFCQAKAVS